MAGDSYARLNVRAFGLATGVLYAVGLAGLGIAASYGWGGSLVDPISSFYTGFGSSARGILMGFLWGFIDGAIGGVLLAWLYNELSERL